VSQTLALLLPSLLAAGGLLIVLSRPRPTRPARRVSPRAQRWADWMVQAGVGRVRPGQLVAFCVVVGLLAGVVTLGLTGSLWIALAFTALIGYLPVMVLRGRQRRRARELQEVWPDAIDHLISGVRAGLALPEAVAGLAERGPELLRPHFARFANRYQTTGQFSVALKELKDELADPSADVAIEALRLAREVGGTELGQTLRTLSASLREEYNTRQEIQARQSWVVVAARLSFAVPWAILLLLATRPEAVAAYRSPGGGVVIAVGAAMASLGYRIMLRIARLRPEERVLR
jgi:tight adherence protein B